MHYHSRKGCIVPQEKATISFEGNEPVGTEMTSNKSRRVTIKY
jgi:hypothetical protein